VDAVGRHEERGRGADLLLSRGSGDRVPHRDTRAKKREAKVYAELLGYGVSSDAEHISEPDPTG
jgi:3-oxoacyl-[acyl-carrier-protein] synthase II